ncbi:uncharacterized protein LOC143462271 [Clavelina lepadiformis]|uniref:uncharacterized protein LOC143462271 n=1 Tax=Clavelina lepadiformis TaxID=159417 RepID=UPI0040424402
MKNFVTFIVLVVAVLIGTKIIVDKRNHGTTKDDKTNPDNVCTASTTDKKECAPIPEKMTNGEITCTDSNMEGSTCKFQCTKHNFHLHPSSSSESTCLPSGKWSNLIPCCVEPCPPHLLMDMAILVHRNNYDDFATINAVAADLLPQLKMGQGGLHYARMYFSGNIHEPRILFEDSVKMTSEEVLHKVTHELNFNNTEDGRVNIGAALRYVKDHVFGVEGDRPDIPNVLFVSTDSNSDDDVAAPAKALRDAGVLINAVFYESEGIVPNDQMLLDITGNQRLITKRAKNHPISYYQKLNENFFKYSCYATCQNYV